MKVKAALSESKAYFACNQTLLSSQLAFSLVFLSPTARNSTKSIQNQTNKNYVRFLMNFVGFGFPRRRRFTILPERAPIISIFLAGGDP